MITINKNCLRFALSRSMKINRLISNGTKIRYFEASTIRVSILSSLRPYIMNQNRQCRQDNNRKNYRQNIAIYVRNCFAYGVAKNRHADSPQQAAESVKDHESSVVHPAHTSYY